eukprot:1977231-Pleurochrysis_carterae.AAC.2
MLRRSLAIRVNHVYYYIHMLHMCIQPYYSIGCKQGAIGPHSSACVAQLLAGQQSSFAASPWLANRFDARP